MQNSDCIYIAGWNIPGYLPESEPAIFDNETDAIYYLSYTINRLWDEDYLSSESYPAIDNRWMDLHSSLTYETAPFNVQNGDGTLTFWVAIVPRSDLPTYEKEDN